MKSSDRIAEIKRLDSKLQSCSQVAGARLGKCFLPNSGVIKFECWEKSLRPRILSSGHSSASNSLFFWDGTEVVFSCLFSRSLLFSLFRSFCVGIFLSPCFTDLRSNATLVFWWGAYHVSRGDFAAKKLDRRPDLSKHMPVSAPLWKTRESHTRREKSPCDQLVSVSFWWSNTTAADSGHRICLLWTQYSDQAEFYLVATRFLVSGTTWWITITIRHFPFCQKFVFSGGSRGPQGPKFIWQQTIWIFVAWAH